MALTNIIYKDVAPGALQNVTPAIADLQPFCGLADLKQEAITPPRAATLERDYWRLDGSLHVFPDDPTGKTWGLWSKSMSGEGGVFAVPPVLTLSFTELYSSVGLTFYFNEHGPDWCRDLNVKWYRDSTLLAEEDFTPNAWEYPCVHEVRHYNRIVVTFRAMSKPFRYLKLSGAIYGIMRTFGPDELRTVNLFQAASPISEDLEINTMSVTVSSRDPVPFLFQRKQPMEVHHNGSVQGVFYISKSRRTGDRTYEIEADDMLGLLDESSHIGGVYTNIAFAALVAEIMGPFAYELDPVLEAVRLSGWLPMDSRRANLAQAAFAAGAVVDTSGSGVVRIYPVQTVVKAAFDAGRVFEGATVETVALVTAVEVTEHRYTPGDEERELFSDTIGGTAEVVFSEPMHSLVVTGGEILESGANYAILRGNESVTLHGKQYSHTTQIVRVARPIVDAAEVEKTLTVTDATLVGPGNSAQVAQRVYDHYQRRESVKVTLILDRERPGDMVTVSTGFDGVKTGVIQSLDMDLGRKRIGEAVIVCE